MKIWLAAIIVVSAVARATTVEMERGPAPAVQVVRDLNLYDIYVKPPRKSATYSPGRITVYLSRDNPDFMRIPLATELLADGRLHARINIDPAKESTYSIYVYDQQPKPGEQLLLLASPLSSFVASQQMTPNKSLERTRER